MKLISVNQQKQPQTQRLGCEIASDIIELKMQGKSRNKFVIMASIFSVKGPHIQVRAVILWQIYLIVLLAKQIFVNSSKFSVPLMAFDSKDR